MSRGGWDLAQPGDPNASGNHRKNMIRSLEDSLTRLETDYVDLLRRHPLPSSLTNESKRRPGGGLGGVDRVIVEDGQ